MKRPLPRTAAHCLGRVAMAAVAVLVLSASGGEDAEQEEFDRLFDEQYEKGLDDKIEVKCFRKGDFNACLQMQQDGGGRNPAFVRKMFEIAQQGSNRQQFETLLSLPQIRLDPGVWQSSKHELQKIYRRDGAQSGQAYYHLKAYLLDPNLPDLERFLAGGSIDELHQAIGEDRIRNSEWFTRYRDTAVQRYLQKGGVRGYYYAYAATQHQSHLQRAVALSAAGGEGIESDVFGAYLNVFVRNLNDVPGYATLVEKCRDCNRRSLYEHVANVPGFFRSSPLQYFQNSIENRYYFSKVGYSVKEMVDGRQLRVEISSNRTSIGLSADSQCVDDGEGRETVSVGFMDSFGLILGSGGRAPKEKIIHYKRFRCSLSRSDVSIIDNINSLSLAPKLLSQAHSTWTVRSNIGEEIVWENGSNFVMVEADGVCMAGCTAKSLQISGGPGEFRPSHNGSRSGSIHKGYQGIAGTYRYTVQIGEDICSGTFSLSGTRPGYRIRLYPHCRDAGSTE